jgi:AcrR family transcriptional regulator
MRKLLRPSRKDQQAGTRARLIECAHEVFLQRGFHAATLEDIALAAGLTKGAVYSNFASKAELFLAVGGERMAERLSSYKEARATVTRLDTLVREYARIMIRHDPDGRWASVVAEAWAVAAGDPRFRAALIDQQASANAFISDSMLDMAERTGVEFLMPIAKMSKVGGALMRGLLLQRLLDPKGVPMELIEEAFVTCIRAMAQRQSTPRRARRDHDDFSSPRATGRATARRGA